MLMKINPINHFFFLALLLVKYERTRSSGLINLQYNNALREKTNASKQRKIMESW